jgi:hypothetical protein
MARFLFESVSDEEIELASLVATEVDADFTSPVEVWDQALAVPPAVRRDLESGEVWVYLRREPALAM